VNRSRGTARGIFSFKVKSDHPGLGESHFDCEATFDFHPEHGWRLRGCRILTPGTNTEIPEQP
jgi:hypothetical protein